MKALQKVKDRNSSPVTLWVVEMLIKADLFFLGWGELSDVREVTALNLK